MSPKKRESKEPKISLRDIESKLLFIKDLESKDRFYTGFRLGIFLSLFGNLFILMLYDSVIKNLLKDRTLIIFVLIITAIILLIILTFLRDKQVKVYSEMAKESHELEEMKEKAVSDK